MLSDHCPLFYSLEIPKNLKDIREGTPLKNAPRNFLWSDKGIAQFLVSLKSANNKKILSSILELDFNDPNKIVEALTNSLTDITEKSKIKRFPGSNTHSRNNPPWFDKNSSNLKKEITALGKKN